MYYSSVEIVTRAPWGKSPTCPLDKPEACPWSLYIFELDCFTVTQRGTV